MVESSATNRSRNNAKHAANGVEQASGNANKRDSRRGRNNKKKNTLGTSASTERASETGSTSEKQPSVRRSTREIGAPKTNDRAGSQHGSKCRRNKPTGQKKKETDRNVDQSGSSLHRASRNTNRNPPQQGAARRSSKKDHSRIATNGKSVKTSDGYAETRAQNQRQQDLLPYPPYYAFQECFDRYAAKDPSLIRGRIRTLFAQKDNGMAFVTCDRGTLTRDVLLETKRHQNRALDGDIVFVELDNDQEGPKQETANDAQHQEETSSEEELDAMFSEKLSMADKEMEKATTWQDDAVQRRLWNPIVPVVRKEATPPQKEEEAQSKGQVVYVMPSSNAAAGAQPSELNPSDQSYRLRIPRRAIVGTLKQRGTSGYLLVPNNKSLPEFFCRGPIQHGNAIDNIGNNAATLYKAEYVYGSWKKNDYWPPCARVECMGDSCNVEDETMALLIENGVDHGDFTAPVFEDVNKAVDSGMIALPRSQEKEANLGWQPTPDMYQGRRDYTKQRIFTIDPTTAKDLDDAVHITPLSDDRVEIGVHIADVSNFVKPETAVDEEAQRRGTTVYLVDRTVPMLPRPLCEVACSLNENVERLAFSCVWTMNMDGTLREDGEIWYGKSVIKSCSRLDYATAQNIIENKVATGESQGNVDETLWPRNRQPTAEGGHTIDQVAADVRLMNRVAQARRRLRFQNGALALNGIKLAFQLEEDGETPMLCEPYPIRDSNRLIEELMLLSNYLVAQRLITHVGGLALLRMHPPPLTKGMESVVDVAQASIGFRIDSSSSQSLQESLSRLGRECQDEMVLQCVTELLMTPMQQAEYMAAGEVEQESWHHFALNIPYYTHFTSPIRRYADIVVHRLLQASIEGQDAVDAFLLDQKEIHAICMHCNEKKMASKKAQDRSDRVFLALYLRRHPLRSQQGVVLSVGQKTFTVFVPSLGLSTLVYLDEHKEKFKFQPYTTSGDDRRIRLETKKDPNSTGSGNCFKLDIKVFSSLCVTCVCKEKPPIDVKVMVEGPWIGE